MRDRDSSNKEQGIKQDMVCSKWPHDHTKNEQQQKHRLEKSVKALFLILLDARDCQLSHVIANKVSR